MGKIILIPILLSLVLPIGILANDTVELHPPIAATSFEAIVNNLVDFVFKIAIVLAPLMIIVGGVLLVTAGGSPGQVDRAKRILLWTAIGFLIVMLAKGIMGLIESLLGV